MTRKECEDKLLALSDEIMRVYQEYNPNGEYLMITINADRTDIKDRFDGRSIKVSQVKDAHVIRTEDWERIFDTLMK